MKTAFIAVLFLLGLTVAARAQRPVTTCQWPNPCSQ